MPWTQGTELVHEWKVQIHAAEKTLFMENAYILRVTQIAGHAPKNHYKIRQYKDISTRPLLMADKMRLVTIERAISFGGFGGKALEI